MNEQLLTMAGVILAFLFGYLCGLADGNKKEITDAPPAGVLTREHYWIPGSRLHAFMNWFEGNNAWDTESARTIWNNFLNRGK